MDKLVAIQKGQWTESVGGMLCNAHPTHGGIIDKAYKSGEWFVIFNDDRYPVQDGFLTREDAIDSFVETIKASSV